jgi:hypothetical protein
LPAFLAAVDAALEELVVSVPRSNRVLGILPPSMDEQNDSGAEAMMGLAAASMAMLMTREWAVVAARGRRDARPVPLLRRVGRVFEAHRLR